MYCDLRMYVLGTYAQGFKQNYLGVSLCICSGVHTTITFVHGYAYVCTS